jgi:peptidoglycan hydrolase-like protein with peptidoglycan-binding domain
VGIPAAHRRERHDDARHRPARLTRRSARLAGLAGTLTAALLLPPAAAAQDPPAPAPEPVQGTLKLTAQKVMRDGERRVALTRTAWRVRGELRPFVPGQTVVVRFFRDGRKVREQIERLKSIRRGAAGEFLTPFTSRSAGRVVVSAVHLATPELDTVRSENVRVNVMSPVLGGSVTRLFQKHLARMKYAVSRTGVFDDATARAVMAYRKVNGMPRTYSPSEAVVRGVLAGDGAFKPRYPGNGRHVEADISRQVLALINRNGRVHRVYHTSTGAPATPTVLGRFRVYRKSPGTNAKGMVHSSYFIRGYAMHGYASVPPYNASHGCLRVPIPNAWSIYSWVRMGTVVRVYP